MSGRGELLPGPIERDSLLAAIDQVSRHLITILIADDEPLIRKMFTMFLSGQGYKVVEVEGGFDRWQTKGFRSESAAAAA